MLQKAQKQSGFTLIEIAIVLVIIGLLLGGVLKGQELINSAKVRAMSDKFSGVSAAFFAFQDRYKALPGDYSKAAETIDAALTNGNGNGQVRAGTAETGGVWTHLEQAGFLTGSFDGNQYNAGQACPASTCPTNGFGATMNLNWSNRTDSRVAAHELKSGQFIPVEILAELDRKIDDEKTTSGILQLDRGFLRACDNNGEYNTLTEVANCAAVYNNF